LKLTDLTRAFFLPPLPFHTFATTQTELEELEVERKRGALTLKKALREVAATTQENKALAIQVCEENEVFCMDIRFLFFLLDFACIF
jgi:hypothetical protein